MFVFEVNHFQLVQLSQSCLIRIMNKAELEKKICMSSRNGVYVDFDLFCLSHSFHTEPQSIKLNIQETSKSPVAMTQLLNFVYKSLVTLACYGGEAVISCHAAIYIYASNHCSQLCFTTSLPTHKHTNT